MCHPLADEAQLNFEELIFYDRNVRFQHRVVSEEIIFRQRMLKESEINSHILITGIIKLI
jgi:hypothetical protein